MDTAPRYDVVSRLFHWTVAVLVLVTIPVGIAMTSLGFASIRDALYVTHKSLGVVILVLVTLRLVWRLLRSAPALPEAVSVGERRAARVGHALLYGLLLAMAVTGYARTAGGGFPVEILDALGLGPFVPETESADTLSVVHAFGAWLTVALIAGHVAMVVRTHLWGGARVLRRMWPPIGGGTGEQDA